MDEEVFNSLSDRKKRVLLHLESELDSPLGSAEYIITDRELGEPDPVDFVLMEPSEEFDYYYLSTVGLSKYRFENNAGSEIGIILPNTFVGNFTRIESRWPLDLLSAVAYSAVDNMVPVSLLRIYQVDEEDRNEYGGNLGGVVVLPEYMNASFLEELIEGSYTRFFVFVPINSIQLAKAQDVGIREFVEYDLHDVSGPTFVANYDAPKVNTTLQKIINHNMKNLKK